jgi:hypothetical protein
MMPKARIFKDAIGWNMSVSFQPQLDQVELYTGIPSFQAAVDAMQHYRMTLLGSIAKQAAPQKGLVH